MVFHRYDQRGTPTYINAVVELVGGGASATAHVPRRTRSCLAVLRWRGHISPHDEQHWVVPESVDPASYIEEVPFVHGDFREAIMEHVSSRFRDPLPDGCSKQVLHQLSGVGQTALFFRISHTIADAIVLLAVLNTVFEKDDDALRRAGGERARRRRRRRRRGAAAARARPGVCERLGAMIGGFCRR